MAVLLFAAVSWGQTAHTPSWQEFSIGPPKRPGGRYGRDGIRADGVTLKKILSRAYGLPEHRVVGPDWMATERYALQAVSNPDDFQALMQHELATRFHLMARREQREVPVYVLKAIEGRQPKAAAGNRGPVTVESTPMLRMPQATILSFAEALADVVLRPVYDETGLAGNFEISLGWKLGNEASLHDAVKQQLGLELANERRTVELLLVDSIERPQFSQ